MQQNAAQTLDFNVIDFFCRGYQGKQSTLEAASSRLHSSRQLVREYLAHFNQNIIKVSIRDLHTRNCKGWGLSAKLGKHSAIWGKLGTALQAYTLNPCTKFPPNPTSRKVNT